MAPMEWVVFDLGNTIVKLAYERVLQRIRYLAPDTSRDQLMMVMERAGGYRDMERGVVTFGEFYDFLCEEAGYRGNMSSLREIWLDFFDGPIDGIEDVLNRVRKTYRVAYASNSNEVHATYIPHQFAPLFRRNERFIFSHLHKCAKPDRVFYERMLKVLGAAPANVVFIDDLIENVRAAMEFGMRAYQFNGAMRLMEALERDGILPPQ